MQENILNYDSRLDWAFLESIYEDDKENAAIGFGHFLKCYPAQFNELEVSFSSGDVNTFRQKIHKLKPTFSFVGLTHITAKAETIEKKCSENIDIANLHDLYLDFKNTLCELIPVVKQEFNRLNA